MSNGVMTSAPALRDEVLRDEHGHPLKVGFVHIPRTAGSFVDGYLYRVLHERGYAWHNSWLEKDRDWNEEEMHALMGRYETRALVHNHVGGWPESVFSAYREAGWFCFAFIRHPGDHLCSVYHFLCRRGREIVESITVDEFLRAVFDPSFAIAMPEFETGLGVPAYWRQLDFVAEYTDDAFADFLARTFDHTFVPQERANATQNPGYAALRADGVISDATHEAYLASLQYRTYLEISGKEREGSEPDGPVAAPTATLEKAWNMIKRISLVP